jgi:pheromone shutdown-related protein TraB
MLERREIETTGQRIVLLGTGVLGPDTLDEIEAAILDESPDTVVVDYDETRWSWLVEPHLREDLDLVQVIRNGDLPVLNSRLAFSVLQKRLAPRFEVAPDADIRRAVEAARETGAEVVFGRRPVEIEGVRGWRAGGVSKRLRLGISLVIGSLRPSVVERDEAAELRDGWEPAEIRAEARLLAKAAGPVFFDEADRWLVSQIRDAGERVVVVVNSTAVQPVARLLGEEEPPDVDGLDEIPQPSAFARAVPWIFSAAIVAAFVLGFAFADFDKMMNALLAWCVANVTFGALGALVCLAHPWSIVATSLSAPFVSLNPAVGAGMVGALVQALVAPPSVRDMERVGDDVTEWRGWWRNRLSRIILIFVLGNVFSSVGSFVALAWIPT